jgi:hypothetical protein
VHTVDARGAWAFLGYARQGAFGINCAYPHKICLVVCPCAVKQEEAARHAHTAHSQHTPAALLATRRNCPDFQSLHAEWCVAGVHEH